VNCPECKGSTSTLHSCLVSDGNRRRRRECETCGHRFTTFELEGGEMRRTYLSTDQLAATLAMLAFVRDNCDVTIKQLAELLPQAGEAIPTNHIEARP
jgi:protein-arginine kinase activator protein McsA